VTHETSFQYPPEVVQPKEPARFEVILRGTPTYTHLYTQTYLQPFNRSLIDSASHSCDRVRLIPSISLAVPSSGPVTFLHISVSSRTSRGVFNFPFFLCAPKESARIKSILSTIWVSFVCICQSARRFRRELRSTEPDEVKAHHATSKTFEEDLSALVWLTVEENHHQTWNNFMLSFSISLNTAYSVLQKSDSVWKTGLPPQTCSKPAENPTFERKTCRNALKTWFLLDRQGVYEGLDKRCKPPGGFIDKNLPKTWIKPGLTLIKPGSTATIRGLSIGLSTREFTQLNKTGFFGSVYDRFISSFRSFQTETVYRFCPKPS
jgi:hypothetical protein